MLILYPVPTSDVSRTEARVYVILTHTVSNKKAIHNVANLCVTTVKFQRLHKLSGTCKQTDFS